MSRENWGCLRRHGACMVIAALYLLVGFVIVGGALEIYWRWLR